MTEAFRGTRPPGITGLATADAKQQASAEERSEIYECWKDAVRDERTLRVVLERAERGETLP